MVFPQGIPLVSLLLVFQGIASPLAVHSSTSAPNALQEVSTYSKLKRLDTPIKLNRRSYNTVIRPTQQQAQYVTEVKFNGEAHSLLIDTGSSDTWMIRQDYQCLSVKGKPVPQSTCNLGDPYVGTLEPLHNQTSYAVYGSGEFVTGPFYAANLTVAGLTVPNQQVALIDKAYVVGDGIRSGLLGLGPRGSTGSYPKDNNPSIVPTGKPSGYSPVFESMYNRTGFIMGMFSLALERGLRGGYLAFGGLPPLIFKHNFTTVPMAKTNIAGELLGDVYHSVKPQGYTVDDQTFDSDYVVTIDSGTAANRVPAKMAARINAAYDPPAVLNKELGIYFTNCNATTPEVAITIGGTSFKMHKDDMFLHVDVGKLCATSFTNGFAGSGFNDDNFPDGFYVLGDSWLYNVVAVFDKAKEQMHFAPRVEY